MGDNYEDLDKIQTQLLDILRYITIKNFEEYDISKLLFNISGEALQLNCLRSLKRFIRILLFEQLNCEFDEFNSDLPLIITYNYHRKDHTEYWERFKKIVGVYNEIEIEAKKAKLSSLRKTSEMIRLLCFYYSICKQLNMINEKPVRRILAAYLADLMLLKQKLDSLKIINKSAFIFFDGNYIENLIVQNLRHRGVTVATMQHGQPVFHGMGRDRINQTMILNFSSDYIMVTGEFSKKQFMLGGVPSEHIFIGGSLRKVKPLKQVQGNNFAVFLDCPTNPNAKVDNLELLDAAELISELCDSNYIIKCHPQDDSQNYKDIVMGRGTFASGDVSICDVLKDKAFGLLHASGVYLDIIAEGVKAFCYVNDTDFALVEEGLDSFKDAKELSGKIQEWDSYDLNKKRKYMDQIIQYYLYPIDVKNRYLNFVQTINYKRDFGGASVNGK